MKRAKIILTGMLFCTLWLFATENNSSVLIGPQCNAEAKILEIGYETRIMDDKSEKDFPYVKFIILNVINKDSLGACELFSKGDIYVTSGGSNPINFLMQGDIINTGVEQVSTMTPDGAITFLHWQPILFTEPSKENNLPGTFHLQSVAKPISRGK